MVRSDRVAYEFDVEFDGEHESGVKIVEKSPPENFRFLPYLYQIVKSFRPTQVMHVMIEMSLPDHVLGSRPVLESLTCL